MSIRTTSQRPRCVSSLECESPFREPEEAREEKAKGKREVMVRDSEDRRGRAAKEAERKGGASQMDNARSVASESKV